MSSSSLSSSNSGTGRAEAGADAADDLGAAVDFGPDFCLGSNVGGIAFGGCLQGAPLSDEVVVATGTDRMLEVWFGVKTIGVETASG